MSKIFMDVSSDPVITYLLLLVMARHLIGPKVYYCLN
jgi:hypothetical protein